MQYNIASAITDPVPTFFKFQFQKKGNLVTNFKPVPSRKASRKTLPSFVKLQVAWSDIIRAWESKQ